MYQHVYSEIIDMCIGMHIDMCLNMCTDMCTPTLDSCFTTYGIVMAYIFMAPIWLCPM